MAWHCGRHGQESTRRHRFSAKADQPRKLQVPRPGHRRARGDEPRRSKGWFLRRARLACLLTTTRLAHIKMRTCDVQDPKAGPVRTAGQAPPTSPTTMRWCAHCRRVRRRALRPAHRPAAVNAKMADEPPTRPAEGRADEGQKLSPGMSSLLAIKDSALNDDKHQGTLATMARRGARSGHAARPAGRGQPASSTGYEDGEAPSDNAVSLLAVAAPAGRLPERTS